MVKIDGRSLSPDNLALAGGSIGIDHACSNWRVSVLIIGLAKLGVGTARRSAPHPRPDQGR
jgi:hypothetical protein